MNTQRTYTNMSTISPNPDDQINSSLSHTNDHHPPLVKAIDQICCDLLDDLYGRAGGTIWNASVILKLKVINLYFL